MLYLYIGAILVCESAAFAFLKHFSLTRNPWHFVIGVLLYAAVCFFLVRSFAYEGIGVVNVLWSVFSIVTIIAVGALAFHESLDRKEVLGVGFALVGIILLGGR